MTFEKALEAMKQGKETLREYWKHNSSAVVGIDTDNDGEKRLYIRHLDDHCKEKHYCHFGSSDAMADDWEIYEPKKKIDPDAFKNVDMEPGKALTDLWFVKANQHTEEYAKIVREKKIKPDSFKSVEALNDALKLGIISHSDYMKMEKRYEEDFTMYTTLEITFKSGDTISYSKDEWDDYSYDGNAVSVKKDGAWVGIYNFDHVFSVELKK